MVATRREATISLVMNQLWQLYIIRVRGTFDNSLACLIEIRALDLNVIVFPSLPQEVEFNPLFFIRIINRPWNWP